jgi:hypothetical protein
MIIRNEQFKALTEVADAGYVQSAVAHLKTYDPLLASAAGDEGLAKVARNGLTAARGYGLGQGRALQLYLQLMMSFGSGFDTDPQFRWLHPFLQNMEGVGALERARLLHFHATSYLDRAFGERGKHGQAALERISLLTVDRLRDVGKDFHGRGARLLEYLHPQRMDYLEPDVMDDLISSAWTHANQASLPMPESAVLLFLLMFAFGHQVCEDPLHPWLERQLRSGGANDGPARLQQLETRSKTYLEMMLRQLKETSA